MEDDKLDYGFSTAPVLFAERIAHIGFGRGVARLYATRFDAPLEGGDARKEQPVAQLVLPMDSLVDTAVFLESWLKDMEASGKIDKDLLETARKSFAEPPVA